MDILDEFVTSEEDVKREEEKQRIIDNGLESREKRYLTREELNYIIDFLELDPHSDWDVAIEMFNDHKRTLLKSISNVKVYIEDDETVQRIRDEYERHYHESRLHAGMPVGGIAAGSIGEPSTQMVLNSVDYNETVMVLKSSEGKPEGEIVIKPVGELIDTLMENGEVKNVVSDKGTPTEYLEVKNYSIPSVDSDGKIMWKKIEAVTRHPPVDKDGKSCDLIKVYTKSGRSVIATPAKSFLIRKNNKIEAINGSELKVGDRIPISKRVNSDHHIYDYINIEGSSINGTYLRSDLEKMLKQNLNSSDRNIIQTAINSDVYLDEIVSITSVKSSHKYVYDFTVEDTRTFELFSGVCCMDSFHNAGQVTSAVVYGVPRLEEIMAATKKPKKKSLTFKLLNQPQFETPFENVKYLRNKCRREFEERYIYDFLSQRPVITNDPIPTEDKWWYDFFSKFYHVDYTEYEWRVRFTFKKQEVYDYDLSLYDISQQIEEYKDCRCVFSPDNIGIIDVYVDVSNLRDPFELIKQSKREPCKIIQRISENPVYYYLRDVVIPYIEFIKITGVNDIEHLFFVESHDEKTNKKKWVIQTSGSNLRDILIHPLVDTKTVLSNFWWETLKVLGIEACRTVLKNELIATFKAGGIGLNDCQLDLLVDSMTHKGVILPASRYGINDVGPLTRSSFEMSAHNMLVAARNGERDPIKNVSSSVILAKLAKVGTGLPELLPNVNMLKQHSTKKLEVIEEDIAF